MQKQSMLLVFLMIWTTTKIQATNNLPENLPTANSLMNLPETEAVVCTANAGSFTTGTQTVCPNATVILSLTGNETAAGYATKYYLTDGGGNVIVASDSEVITLSTFCSEIFIAYAYNYEIGSGANENPTTVSEMDCPTGCCDKLAGPAVVVQDTEAPVFSAPPAELWVECEWDIPAAQDLGYTDNCDVGGTVSSIDGTMTGYCPGTVTRTWTATDACGNTTMVTQEIIIMDTTPPFMDPAPASVTVECMADVPPPVELYYYDNCDWNYFADLVEYTSGSCPTVLTREWWATDLCGNSIAESQNITIMDTTPPVFNPPPASVTVECVADIPAPSALAYTDNCDVAGTVTSTDGPIIGACPATVTRTWTATDVCGNTATATQLIFIDDTTSPVMATPPADVTVECFFEIPPAESLDWTDNCDFSGTVTAPAETTTGDLCNGQFIRTWTYWDLCGNTASVSQTITLLDSTAPVFDTPPPADLTVSCAADMPPAETLNYTDNCGSPGSVTSTDSSNGGTPEIITRTWTAADPCNNITSISQTITLAGDVNDGNDFTVQNGNVYVEDSCKGVILKAPGGACYMIVVDDAGQLVTTPVPCPQN